MSPEALRSQGSLCGGDVRVHALGSQGSLCEGDAHPDGDASEDARYRHGYDDADDESA